MALFSTTTTAQSVMDAVSRDIRQILSSTATPDSTILLDYVDRVCKEMLRHSQWQWLLSAPQLFITKKGVTDYWLGATSGQPAGAYDTGLNLTDVRDIKTKTVYDRTNFTSLQKVNEAPNLAQLAYPDATSRPGRPKQWRQAVDSPQVMNLYPAPDNQSTYAPQPETPICTVVAGGSLLARTYWVTSTFVDTVGNESTSPDPVEIFVPANFLLVVTPPKEPFPKSSSGILYDRYNVYAAQGSSNSDFLQEGQLSKQSSNIATSGTWTEPTSGLVSGTGFPPSFNAVEPIDGYIIEFRYYKQRVPVTVASQVLQIPDDYKDILIHGVLAKTFSYLFRPSEAQMAFALYQKGLTEVIRDMNRSRGVDYIRPDGASIGGRLPAVETFDPQAFQS